RPGASIGRSVGTCGEPSKVRTTRSTPGAFGPLRRSPLDKRHPIAVERSFPHDPKRSDGVVEYWSIGAFSTPILHYSIAPGRQFSTRGRMSEPKFSAHWLGQFRSREWSKDGGRFSLSLGLPRRAGRGEGNANAAHPTAR